ncbi:hypothetical protein [Paraburkholderia sp. J8-2]|uniref:hypothetical protein n=1 Tax=Paraburkholderia sp. J8-2 TaxID=2805440 RepID=UPI002AB70F41|nr:hypothetical protein [Paraburkholderia sp. J8-2]
MSLVATCGWTSTTANCPSRPNFGSDSILIALHRTDCGIKHCYHHAPKLLAQQAGVAQEELDSLAITAAHGAVALDVAALTASKDVPGGNTVSRAVYDVATGKVEIVVAPVRLHPEYISGVH